MKEAGDNFLVLLRSDNVILKILGQFRTFEKAKGFIEENHPDFNDEGYYQWNKFQSDQFITIE